MGRFLDRMKDEGVLDDTLVVIVGDHGYAPEFGLSKPYVAQTSVTHVAGTIIADGRLRPEDVGLLVGDAVEHYDLLNTLMDIIGVPSDSFLQTSVGRSLKRQVRYGSRAVWSNNPLIKLSVVKGDLRFDYDAKSSTMQLHNTRFDPLATHDLFPSESMETKGEFLRLRNFGRQLNVLKGRWKRKCLIQAETRMISHDALALAINQRLTDLFSKLRTKSSFSPISYLIFIFCTNPHEESHIGGFTEAPKMEDDTDSLHHNRGSRYARLVYLLRAVVLCR